MVAKGMVNTTKILSLKDLNNAAINRYKMIKAKIKLWLILLNASVSASAVPR